MATFSFNVAGNVIAFRRRPDNKFLFDKNGNWIGWFPWRDTDAVDKEGTYLGTVIGNRFLTKDSHPCRGYPGYPGYPGYAGYAGYPGYAGHAGYQPGCRDVREDRLKR